MAKKKSKFWSIKNVLTTLKAMATSVVTSLILFIPMWIGRWLIVGERMYAGRGVQLLTLLAGFLIWGWLANKFWGWK